MGVVNDMIWATVVSDASFCSTTRSAGYAYWVRIDGHDKPIKGWGNFKEKPNNSFEAELWAALNGVHAAKANGAMAVLVQSDNTGVVDILPDALALRKKRGGEMAVDVISGLFVTCRHVKGHTGGDTPARWCNNWCDIWAKKAMKEQRGRR